MNTLKSSFVETFYRQLLPFILIALLLVFGTAIPISKSVFLPFGKKTVVIDAGHGGFDSGAIGKKTKVREDGINLKIAKYLEEELTKNNIDVIMTRNNEKALGTTKDDDMYRRRQIINKSGADAVISIHLNINSDRRISGPIVYYMENSERGKKLAECIQEALNDTLTPPKPRKAIEDRFFILRSGKMPCVIVECGFLSNANEEARLTTEKYQKKIAKAIYFGVIDFLEMQLEG